jgi:hypothetical protein
MTLPIYLARGLAGALAAFGLASASAQERPPLAPLDD